MVCSGVKAIRIHYSTVREAVQVADELIDTLERWCRWGISMDREAFYYGTVNRSGIVRGSGCVLGCLSGSHYGELI